MDAHIAVPICACTHKELMDEVIKVCPLQEAGQPIVHMTCCPRSEFDEYPTAPYGRRDRGCALWWLPISFARLLYAMAELDMAFPGLMTHLTTA